MSDGIMQGAVIVSLGNDSADSVGAINQAAIIVSITELPETIYNVINQAAVIISVTPNPPYNYGATRLAMSGGASLLVDMDQNSRN